MRKIVTIIITMGYYGIDIYYIVLVLPCVLLSVYCSIKVKSTFSKYDAVDNSTGRLSQDVAASMMATLGANGVRITQVGGSLTDHYNPSTNVLALSQSTYSSSSIAAVAVACHEAGHAVQKATRYPALVLRSTLVPLANLGSQAAPFLILLGLFMNFQRLLYLGIAAFGISVLFYLVTLPVEFNASHRALKYIEGAGCFSQSEVNMSRKVLTAAALTYVASALTALAQLLRFILIARRGSNRRR